MYKRQYISLYAAATLGGIFKWQKIMKLTQKLSTTTQTKRLEKMRQIPRTAAETAPGTVLKTAPKAKLPALTGRTALQTDTKTLQKLLPSS